MKIIDIQRKYIKEVLKKNNSITDAKNGFFSLRAMKLADILLQTYNKTETNEFTIELKKIRKFLGMQNNQNYVEEIKYLLKELKMPFELRDYVSVKGEMVQWSIVSFLNEAKIIKNSQHLINISISESFIKYLTDKAGYTPIDLNLSNRFKSKYGYKIYELHRRYLTLPNRHYSDVGYIEMTIDDLNFKFGTNHIHSSKMLEGIKRGITEIKKITDIELFCFYDNNKNKFVFSWEKPKIALLENTNMIIPEELINEVVDWICLHKKGPIDNQDRYKGTLIRLIKKNELDELEDFYRGMLIYKYKMTLEEIDSTKNKFGVYTLPK